MADSIQDSIRIVTPDSIRDSIQTQTADSQLHILYDMKIWRALEGCSG